MLRNSKKNDDIITQTTSRKNEGKFQSDKVFAISLGHMLHDTYSSFLAPLVPLLVEKLGITLALAGLLDSVRNIPSLLNPLFGLLADRINTKIFVIITPAVTAVIMSLIGTAPSYSVAVIMIFVMGISASLFHVPAPVMINNFSGSKTGKGMSWYMLGGEISRTLGPLIITGAISLWGLEGTWKLIPFGLIASFFLYLKLKNVHQFKSEHESKKNRSQSYGFKKHLPLFGSIAGYTVFMMALKISVTLFLPAYLVFKGRTLVSASFHLSVLQFAGAVGTLTAGTISDKIGRKNTLYISGFMCPLFMWIFLVSPIEFNIPILAALGFFLFASGPVLLALVQNAGSHSPAFSNGLYMTINFTLRALIVLLVGIFIEKMGFIFAYKFIGFWAVGVLPMIFFITENRRSNVQQ